MQSGTLLVPADGRPVYAVRRVFERARTESALEEIVALESFRQLPDLLRGTAGRTPRRIGLEHDVLPVAVRDRLAAVFEDAAWVDVSAAIRTIRAVKSPYELDKQRAAGGLSALMLEAAVGSLREGITELDLAGRIEAAARRAGHQGLVHMRGWNQEMFYGQVSGGEAGALQSTWRRASKPSPSCATSSATPPATSPWPTHGWTYADASPRMPEKFARAHDAAVAILTDVQSAIRPGVTPQDLYRRAVARAEVLGYADHFMGQGSLRARFVGHGVGLELDEWPVLAEGWTQPLEPGHVFCVEPKIVFPGEGAVGIEDQFAVTPDGAERLTRPAQRLAAI